MEKRFIRTNSLGKDRYYNRYWFFKRDGRIFIESSDSAQWGYYSTKEEVFMLLALRITLLTVIFVLLLILASLAWQLDTFVASLNRKGERERALKKQLEKYYTKIWWVNLKFVLKQILHFIQNILIRNSSHIPFVLNQWTTIHCFEKQHFSWVSVYVDAK